MVERNDQGQLLLDPEELAKEAAGDKFSRYNGGWVKHIIRLDKTKTNGFSLVGDFLKSGLQWLSPGVYLDCSIDGSRKRHEKRHTLFRLHSDGRVEKLDYVGDQRDWAVRLWPKIEEALGATRDDSQSLLAIAEWLDQIYSSLKEKAASLDGDRKAAARRAAEAIFQAIDDVRIAAGEEVTRE